MLDSMFIIQRGANADYQVSDAVTMMMMSVLSGVRHMAHTVMIKNDEVLRAIFRWDKTLKAPSLNSNAVPGKRPADLSPSVKSS
jgi:hypothetical protein